ncbi:Ferri-bacillibactin esterase BesA [Hartmannibacter diazotrophicus]|uniref:Ferri-bacillibactin esterase BesA n=1 Tax=Hartmannibacter diazotrophicus TaxID=1482074 RepID=A0A2C9DAP4_9HYPH|nr:alpha/beta hydrolase-fold protein [Hartmannibacter diazotrophicus]SON56675.1 Ferri-bacillibactin esterase BesA [Hartmannibacter diazotrophicus]
MDQPVLNVRSAPLAGTTIHDIVGANGAIYRVFVHSPDSEPPADGWPALFMTDGNAVIATAVDALRVQADWPAGTNVGKGVIVAIGYPTDAPYDPLRRSWDLGPPPGQTYPPFFEGTPEVKTGGAEEFAAFIEQEVKPLAASIAPLDPARQTLFGHSFGGLFALHTLFTRPRSFLNWIAVSPAIYWEGSQLIPVRDRFLANLPNDLSAFVHLSAGEYEGDSLAPFQLGAEDEVRRLEEKRRIRTVAAAHAMAGDLARLSNGKIRTDFEIFPRETHMSVLPVAVGRAVQIAFAVREPRRPGAGIPLD